MNLAILCLVELSNNYLLDLLKASSLNSKHFLSSNEALKHRKTILTLFIVYIIFSL